MLLAPDNSFPGIFIWEPWSCEKRVPCSLCELGDHEDCGATHIGLSSGLLWKRYSSGNCLVSPICSEAPPESSSASYRLCFPMPGPPSRNLVLVDSRSLPGPGETTLLVKDACCTNRRVLGLNFQSPHKCWGGMWWHSHIPSTQEG